MYFLSKSYAFGKDTLIGIGGIAGIGSIVYGSLLGTSTQGLIFIIGGSIWVVQTAIMFFDNNKLLNKIRKQLIHLELDLECLSKENRGLKGSIDILRKCKDKFIADFDKLQQNLRRVHGQLLATERLKEQYKKETNSIKTSNNELKITIENLIISKESVQNEALNLRMLLHDTKLELDEIKRTKELYEAESTNMQNLCSDKKEIEKLREQNTALTNLYDNARILILTMAEASSTFDSFSDSLNESLVKLQEPKSDEISQTMSTLNKFMSKISPLTALGITPLKSSTDVSSGGRDLQTSCPSRDEIQMMLNMKDPVDNFTVHTS